MFRGPLGRHRIAPAALYRRMQQREPITVVDVTSRERWVEGHVPGATNLDPTTYDAGALPADRDAPVVFYCSNALCRRAPTAASRARKMGFRNVLVMSAGISGWRGANLPTQAGG